MRDGGGKQRTDRAAGVPPVLRLVAVVTIVLGSGALLATSAAQAQGAGEPRRGTEFSAQSRSETTRPRTRVLVRPPYPYRRYSTDYPVPYTYEYPGPNGVRQCKARLVQEMRPSGPTVVPRMQCWWEVR